MAAKKKKTKGPKKSVKDLTPRQRLYVDGKLNGKSNAQAARDAGYAESVALKAETKLGPVVNGVLAQLMDKAGLTDDYLVAKMREGVEATETKFFQKEGVVQDERTCVNFGERRQMVELVARFKGHAPVERHAHLHVSYEQLLAGVDSDGGSNGDG